MFKFLQNEKKENVRFFTAKGGERFVIVNNPSFNVKVDEFNELRVYDEWQNQAGEVQYLIKENNVCYLENIFVNDNDKGKGIAFYLLNFLEEIAKENGCKVIEGEFLSRTKEDKEKAKKFYHKNGFKISNNNKLTKIISLKTNNEHSFVNEFEFEEYDDKLTNEQVDKVEEVQPN